MSTFTIAYPNNDGSVALIFLAQGITEQQAIDAVPPNTPYRILDISELPTDGTFRDAWEMDFSEPEEVVSEEVVPEESQEE